MMYGKTTMMLTPDSGLAALALQSAVMSNSRPAHQAHPMTARLLLIDDDARLSAMVGEYLRNSGFTVETAGSLAAGREQLANGAFDALVLDLMLPDGDGLDLCRELRADARHRQLPLLMLTARGEPMDRIVGLELGADDYLPKPFEPRELLARVKALLRRADLLAAAQANAQAPGRAAPIRNGELEILPAKRQVRCRGELIEFTALEFDLLLHFASHPGHVFSRSQLLNAVWGYTHDGYEHTVTTHINRLRAKLEADPMRPEIILTARGAGYKMRDLA